MWLSVANAAARHRSKPGEERHHLPVRQEAFSRRLDLLSTAHLSIVALLGIRVGSFGPRGVPAGRCRPEGTAVDRCRLPVAIRSTDPRPPGALIPTLARPAGMSQRRRPDRAAVPIYRCLRALARCHSSLSACPRSISAARRRHGLTADPQHGQRRRPRLPGDGKMIFPLSQPMGHRRAAPFLAVCRAASLHLAGRTSRLLPRQMWGGRAATSVAEIAGKRLRRSMSSGARSRSGMMMSAGVGTATRTN